MDAPGVEERRTGGGRTAWLLGLAGALAIGGVAAASGPASTPPSPGVQRAEPVAAVGADDIRSGDDHDGTEPPPVSPAVALAAGRNELTARSPWAGLWGPEIEPLAAYEPQRDCLPGARPAVAALARLLEQAYPQGRDLGISRSCDAGARSEHKEGRAYDWGVRVTVPSERMAAEELVAWLLATDEHGNDFAMARRLGVMYVIWDGHIWSASAARDGWRVYRGPSPHTDHVHLSFSWAGAIGATSFWDAARLGPWLFGHVAVDRLPSSFDLGRDRYRSELGDTPGELRTRGEVPAAAAPGDAQGDAGSDERSSPGAPATTVPSSTAPAGPAPAEPAPVTVPDAPLPTLAPVAPTILPPPPPPPTSLVPDGEAVEEIVDRLDASTDPLLGG